MLLTKKQVLDLFKGWHIDPEQKDDWLRFDKGIKDTGNTVCYVYFSPRHITIPIKNAPIRKVYYSFDRFEIQ